MEGLGGWRFWKVEGNCSIPSHCEIVTSYMRSPWTVHPYVRVLSFYFDAIFLKLLELTIVFFCVVCEVSVTSNFVSIFWWFEPCKSYFFESLFMTPTIHWSIYHSFITALTNMTHTDHTTWTRCYCKLKCSCLNKWSYCDRDPIWDPIQFIKVRCITINQISPT